MLIQVILAVALVLLVPLWALARRWERGRDKREPSAPGGKAAGRPLLGTSRPHPDRPGPAAGPPVTATSSHAAPVPPPTATKPAPSTSTVHPGPEARPELPATVQALQERLLLLEAELRSLRRTQTPKAGQATARVVEELARELEAGKSAVGQAGEVAKPQSRNVRPAGQEEVDELRAKAQQVLEWGRALMADADQVDASALEELAKADATTARVLVELGEIHLTELRSLVQEAAEDRETAKRRVEAARAAKAEAETLRASQGQASDQPAKPAMAAPSSQPAKEIMPESDASADDTPEQAASVEPSPPPPSEPPDSSPKNLAHHGQGPLVKGAADMKAEAVTQQNGHKVVTHEGLL